MSPPSSPACANSKTWKPISPPASGVRYPRNFTTNSANTAGSASARPGASDARRGPFRFRRRGFAGSIFARGIADKRRLGIRRGSSTLEKTPHGRIACQPDGQGVSLLGFELGAGLGQQVRASRPVGLVLLDSRIRRHFFEGL